MYWCEEQKFTCILRLPGEGSGRLWIRKRMVKRGRDGGGRGQLSREGGGGSSRGREAGGVIEGWRSGEKHARKKVRILQEEKGRR